MTRITIQPEVLKEITGVIEDAVEYACTPEVTQGTLISGETVWKIVECLAVAKQAEFEGMFNEDPDPSYS
jgi:hypothetical protein